MRTFLAAVTLLLCATPAWATDGFRCPDTGRIVDVGESMYEVRALCRVPDDAQQHVETRTTVTGDRRRQVVQQIEVTVDDWTYDFGPDRFIRLLHFENGRLLSVREGRYGLRTE
jgi:hypothetical protein